ncbi:OmpA family protein [Trichloromonas sp.]|uniref:OmpA family protein n=1 Tax=Trichloromonas sp. TaxID=3069249 RepID=UPI003D81ADA7
MPNKVLILLALTFSLLASGCVSKTVYQQKVDEADQLTGRIGELETEYQLMVDKNGYLTQRNGELDLRLRETLNRSSALQDDLLRARADIDRLEKILSARSAEAGAAMADMRQSIDRLETQNRDLALQVENERLAREARVAQMKSTYDELVGMMDAEIKRGEVTISELQGKLSVNMVEKILFDSGEAEVKPAGLEVLRRVGGVVKGVLDKEIRVEGHTDNVPISPRLQQKFPSNWELSTARAVNVLHFLQSKVGISGERISACGYGEHRPIAENDSPQGRALNRRIQIVLVPFEIQAAQAPSAAQP